MEGSIKILLKNKKMPDSSTELTFCGKVIMEFAGKEEVPEFNDSP